MRRRVLLLALLLAGCASVPAPQGGSSVSGRLSVQVDATAERPAQSLSASFDLQGSAERGELRLGTPLGTTLALASWSPDEARLATPQGERRFANLEGLSREVFGEADVAHDLAAPVSGDRRAALRGEARERLAGRHRVGFIVCADLAPRAGADGHRL